MSLVSGTERHPIAALPSRVRFALLLAAAFLAAMAWFFTHHDLYRDVGGDLVVSGDFEMSPFGEGGASADRRWHPRGELVQWEPRGGVDGSGSVRLGTREGRGSSLNFALGDPGSAAFLRISSRLRSEGIVAGDQNWTTARLLLTFTDRSGQRESHQVCEIVGTQPWRRCERVIPVPDGAVAAHARVQNQAVAGTLWVDEVRLTPAVEKRSTLFLRAFFATLWCAVVACCARTVRLPRQRFGLAIIVIGFLIVAGVSVPESALDRIVHRGAHTLNGLMNEDAADAASAANAQVSRTPGAPAAAVLRSARPPFGAVVTVKKVGHFILFGLLAYLAFASALRSAPTPSRLVARLATVGTALLLFAASAEVLQFLTVTRQPSAFDWTIDAGGILVGAAIALITHGVAQSTKVLGG